VLLDHKADINEVDSDLRGCVHLAVRAAAPRQVLLPSDHPVLMARSLQAWTGHDQVVKLLADHGAPLTKENKHGRAPMYVVLLLLLADVSTLSLVHSAVIWQVSIRNAHCVVTVMDIDSVVGGRQQWPASLLRYIRCYAFGSTSILPRLETRRPCTLLPRRDTKKWSSFSCDAEPKRTLSMYSRLPSRDDGTAARLTVALSLSICCCLSRRRMEPMPFKLLRHEPLPS